MYFWSNCFADARSREEGLNKPLLGLKAHLNLLHFHFLGRQNCRYILCLTSILFYFGRSFNPEKDLMVWWCLKLECDISSRDVSVSRFFLDYFESLGLEKKSQSRILVSKKVSASASTLGKPASKYRYLGKFYQFRNHSHFFSVYRYQSRKNCSRK